jgi:hypothetical protein
MSSSKRPLIPNYYDKTFIDVMCNESSIPTKCTINHLSSNSSRQLYNLTSSHIAYQSVIKSFGEDFENGGEYYKYIANTDSPGVVYISNEGHTSSGLSNTGWNSGTLVEKRIIKKGLNNEFITLKKESYDYNYNSEYDSGNDERNSDIIKAGIIKRIYVPYSPYASNSYITCDSINSTKEYWYDQWRCTTSHNHSWGTSPFWKGWKCLRWDSNNEKVHFKSVCYGNVPGSKVQFRNKIGDFNITVYDILIRWNYLKQKKIEFFDENGENPIITTVDYEYDNITHNQISKTTTTNSKGIVTLKKIFYPSDFDVEKLSEFQSLVNKGIEGIPIDIRQETNGKLISGQLLKYNDKGQVTELFQAENELGAILPIDTSNPYSYGKRKLLINYDINTGNIKEYNKENDISSVYLWGYNDQFPVAKIENATYTQVTATLTSTELTNIKEGSYSDVTMRSVLNKIRTSLANSLVTTYTYDPLIGVTSITDPSGYTSYYVYDDFNRLQFIKDKDGKVLKSYKYHYQGQADPDAIVEYTVTSTTDGNGTVAIPATVNEGDDVQVSITPYTGYEISSIKVNNVVQPISNSFTISNATSNLTIDVTFSLISNITVSYVIDGGTNGTVSISPTVVTYGGSATVTLTPNSGYEVEYVKVGTTSYTVTNNIATITNITSNTTVNVKFEVLALTVSPTSLLFNSIDGTKTITVTASGSWTVSKSDSWISISTTTGTGNGTFTIRPYKNLDSTSRTGSVTVSNGSTTKLISIEQFPGAGGEL